MTARWNQGQRDQEGYLGLSIRPADVALTRGIMRVMLVLVQDFGGL